MSCLIHAGFGAYFFSTKTIHITKNVSVLHVRMADLPSHLAVTPSLPSSTLSSKALLDKNMRDYRIEQQQEKTVSSESHQTNELPTVPSLTWEENPQPIVERKSFFVYPQHYNNILSFTLDSPQMLIIKVAVDQERIQTYTIQQGEIKDTVNFDKLIKFFPVAARQGEYMLYLSKEEYLQENCGTSDAEQLTSLCTFFNQEKGNHPDYFKDIVASAAM